MAVVRRCALCLSVESRPDPGLDFEGVILHPIWTGQCVCQICARDIVAVHARQSRAAVERPQWPGRYLALRSGKLPIIPCDTIPAPPPSGRPPVPNPKDWA